MKQAKFPKKLQRIFEPHRFKVLYGGRGSAKSYSIAQYLVLKAVGGKELILCTREYQNSIKDSVHALISEVIDNLDLNEIFVITEREIACTLTGTKFIFKGLNRNLDSLKSIHGVTIAFVEEAQTVSQQSLDILLPTIREEGSEILFAFNPDNIKDPIYNMFVVNQRSDALVIKINWQDNPYLPKVLRDQIERDRELDYERWMWIWEGNIRQVSKKSVFHGKVTVKDFKSPETADFMYGADWGFSADPTSLIRGFVKGDLLYIDYEAYSRGIELDDLPAFFDKVPGSRSWPIKADSARPDLISHMRRHGFNIKGAKKWAGSIEAGVDYLKAFKQIIIHPRCKGTIEDFFGYSYKVDRLTGELLPKMVDANNHSVDSARYMFDGAIMSNNVSFISWDSV